MFTGRLRVRGLSTESLNPLILSQSRVTFSFLALLAVMVPARGQKLFSLTARDLWAMARLGLFGMAAANYFYYLAIQRTNVAIAITIQYTAPIWVLFYMALRGRQRATIQRLAAVGLCFCGIAAAIGVFGPARIHLDTLGVVGATLAAFACAFYNIGGHDVMERHDHWTVVFYMTLSASVFWLLLSPPWKVMASNYSSSQWLFLGIFALLSMLIPFSLYFAGLKHLDPTTAIVASCLEPIFAISAAAIALGEQIRTLQVAGMMMVLAGIVIVQLPQSEDRILDPSDPLN